MRVPTVRSRVCHRQRSCSHDVLVMQPINHISFGPFWLDLTNQCLWQGPRAISLRPKPFAVLKLLVENAGQLVTKQQVLEAVWPGTFVSDAVLKDSIRQLREAFGDDAESPAYIETAHRRGYRFIAKVSRDGPREDFQRKGPIHSQSSTTVGLLGRKVELQKMRDSMDRAITGERQIIFVTGEAGIGKTTLVEAFLEQRADSQEILIARGQCLEHYGAGEAYLPVLDAFARLSRSSPRIVDVLRQHAATWLAQMPSLIAPPERESLLAQTAGATRERMLREMAEAVEILAAESPLLLVVEDLHWSDYSTLDLISYLARRRDPARFMLIGTYRPVEVILGEHPLKNVKRELVAHGLCKELPLEYLTEEAISQYLTAKFTGHQFPRRLARLIHRRTEGNPLFMVNAVEYLVQEKVIAEKDGAWRLLVDLSEVELGVPENVKQLIEKQIERLSPDERSVLEGASVVGMECSTVAIAAGLDMPIQWVEKHCEELARRHQFLSPAWLVELPNGTVTARHRFNHVLYVEVPYRLVPPMRRSQIHRRIAEAGVAIYGVRATEIAAELAMHFQQSREWPRAVQYLSQAAENASRRSAHHEAMALARRGLEVLESLPETPERAQHEITLRMILGVSLMAMKGFAAAEVEEVYKRARELGWLQGPTPQLFAMLWSLGLFYIFGGEMQSASMMAEQLLELGRDLDEPALIMEAHRAMGVARLDLGKCTEALEHLGEATKLYQKHRNHRYTVFIGHDCKVVSECFAARALWALGYPDRALAKVKEALALARDISHSQTLVVAAHFASQLHQLRGEPLLAHERAEEVIALADEYGLELWLAFGNINHGWAEFELGNTEHGIQQMRQGLAACEATGARLWRPHFLGLLGGALCRIERLDEGLSVLNEAIALAQGTGESYSIAELHRLKGEWIMKAADAKIAGRSLLVVQAQASLAEALSVAQEQGTKSWELRVRMSLHLFQEKNARRESRQALSDLYSWFTEGFDTADLKNARRLLSAVAEGYG
jgi:DNA-binding winged helix-turn-helix (wHTH) protein/predicted ATPase